MRKLLWALLVLLALGAVGGMVWEPLVATEYKAPPSREYDVEIARDSFGVPHINGKTDADTAYGLAYAHAEDDFSTIEDVVAISQWRILVRAIQKRGNGMVFKPFSVVYEVDCSRERSGV